jgi:hypothetical protein
VPEVGLEPTRAEARGILSTDRAPASSDAIGANPRPSMDYADNGEASQTDSDPCSPIKQAQNDHNPPPKLTPGDVKR